MTQEARRGASEPIAPYHRGWIAGLVIALAPGCRLGFCDRDGAGDVDAGGTDTSPACSMPIVSVGAGGRHTCAVQQDGALFCWGDNQAGQLGTGSAGPTADRATPQRVDVPGSSWAEVAAGDAHTCAIDTNGALFCWGQNFDGQLGVGDSIDRSLPTRVGTLTDWVHVDLGMIHSCGFRRDRSVWCWGNNGGRLGDGATASRDVPTQEANAWTTWQAVSAGKENTFALTISGRMYGTGPNTYGQIGLGNVGDELVLANPNSTILDVANVSMGGDHACAALAAGTVWCWGRNLFGELGIGTPVQDRDLPVQVGTDVRWMGVSTGGDHTCGVMTDHTAWCWGRNLHGQLGVADNQDRTAPVQVGAATAWQRVEAGADHTCALTPTGGLHCWGRNLEGELAQGDTDDRLTPTPVCM
jgi:alpha-tubulin suppressor-like RCC1 family protein